MIVVVRWLPAAAAKVVVVAAEAVAAAAVVVVEAAAAETAAAAATVASPATAAETVGCSCPLPNNPATHFDGEKDDEEPWALLAAAAAGLSIIR